MVCAVSLSIFFFLLIIHFDLFRLPFVYISSWDWSHTNFFRAVINKIICPVIFNSHLEIFPRFVYWHHDDVIKWWFETPSGSLWRNDIAWHIITAIQKHLMCALAKNISMAWRHHQRFNAVLVLIMIHIVRWNGTNNTLTVLFYFHIS